MIVEKLETRRRDFVDAICELPGVLACGAEGFGDAIRIVSEEPVDAFVVGALPARELEQLTTVAKQVLGRDVIVVGETDELVARVEALVRHRREPDPSFGPRAELASRRAGRVALAHRLGVAQRERSSQPARGMQTLVLEDWLPAVCAGFVPRMPGHVELVLHVSRDTPPVRCVPEVLEREMFGIVLEAAAKLPWGGTIWLTAELASDDTVRIDVLENGLGTGGDVTLRTATYVSS